MTATRRLAAILAADVAGYSRLMGADEEGTHARLRAHLAQLVDPKIGEHKGRTVKTTGDGLLAEFASVVDAVRCAAEVQRGMIDREPQVPDERCIRLARLETTAWSGATFASTAHSLSSHNSTRGPPG
jgi:class 3 adenylate cyclase